MLMLKESVAKQNRLVGARVCASTEPSGYTIYTQTCVDLVGDNFAALGNLCLQGRGFVEGNRGVISGCGSNSRDGKVLSIDNHRLSVPLKALVNLNKAWDAF
jgi:hypothetical protein